MIILLYNKLTETQQNPPPLSLKSKKRSMLLDYLASKEKPQLRCEDFKQILNSSPTNLHPDKLTPSLFSFENVQEENMSQLLNSNKRAFAKPFKSKKNSVPLNLTPTSSNNLPNLFLPESPLTHLNSSELDIKPNNLRKTPDKCMKKIWNSGIFDKIQLQDLESLSEQPGPLASKTKLEAQQKFEKKNNELIKIKKMRKNSEIKSFAFENCFGSHLASLKTPKRANEKSADFSMSSLNSPSKISLKASFASKSLNKHRNTKSFRQEKETGNLRNFINGLVEKNFGFKQKNMPVCSKEKNKPVAEKSCQNIEKPEDECQFLSTGYLKYHNNINTKLKISKILVSQHKQERRQTLLLFPPTKKSPNDS